MVSKLFKQNMIILFILLIFVRSDSPISKTFFSRNLVPSQLLFAYPSTIYTNYNPVSFDLTFNELYVLDANNNSPIKSVAIVSSSSSYSNTMTITTTITNGVLRVTSGTSVTTAGTYTFKIVNKNDVVLTTSVTFTVKSDLLVLFANPYIICNPTVDANSITLSFNQNLYPKQMTALVLKKNQQGDVTATISTNNSFNLQNQISFTLPDGQTLDRGFWDFNMNFELDMKITSGQLRVEWDYSTIASGVAVAPSLVTTNCQNYNVNLNFNKVVTYDSIAEIKYLYQFQMTTVEKIIAKGSDKYFESSPADATFKFKTDNAPVANNYNIIVKDTCTRTVTFNNFYVVPVYTITSTSITCIKAGKSFNVDLNWSGEDGLKGDSTFITSVKFTKTGAADTIMKYTYGSGSAFTVKSDPDLGLPVGDYTIKATDRCNNEITSGPFSVKTVPETIDAGTTIFDNNIYTTISFNKSIPRSTIVSITLTKPILLGGVTTITSTLLTMAADPGTSIPIETGNMDVGDWKVNVKFWCDYIVTQKVLDPATDLTISVVGTPTISASSECVNVASSFTYTLTFSSLTNTALITKGYINNGNTKLADTTKGNLAQNVLTFSYSSKLAFTGVITPKVETTSKTTITGKDMLSTGILSFVSRDIDIWDTNLQLTLVNTFSAVLLTSPANQIKSIILRHTTNTNINDLTVTPTLKGGADANTADATAVFASVGVIGVYKIIGVDWCNTEIPGPSIRITTIPTISSFSQRCFVKNGPIATKINFNQMVYTGQMNKATVQHMTNGDAAVDMTVGLISNQSITFNLAAGLPANGDYSFAVTDVASQVINTTTRITIVETLTPTFTINTVLWDAGINLNLVLTTTSTLVNNQVSQVNLISSVGSQTTTTINSQTDTVITLATIVNGLSASTYTVQVVDFCGNVITVDTKILIVNKPSISSISQKCFATNSSGLFSMTVNFSSNLVNGQITSASVVNASNVSSATATIPNNPTNAVLTVSSTNINTQGDYTLTVTDVSSQLITASQKIRITPSLAINSFTNTLWEVNIPLTTTITFNQNLFSNMIVSATFIPTFVGGSNIAMSLGSPVDLQGATITGTATLPAVGTYTIRVVDYCGITTNSAATLNIVARPSFAGMYPLCFTNGQPISSTVTFSQNLVAGYWVDLKFGTNVLTIGTPDNAKLPFTSSGIASAGSGTIRATSVAGTFVDTTKIFRLKADSSSPTISSFDPIVYDVNIPITIAITMNRVLDSSEITSFSLKNQLTNLVTTGLVNSINGNIVTVTANAISVTGNYQISLTDYCDNTILSTSNIAFITIPTISGVTPICYLKNSQISSTITFSSAIITGQLKSVNSQNTANASTSGLVLGSFVGQQQTVTYQNGLPSAFYTMNFKDSSNQIITSGQFQVVDIIVPSTIVSVNPPIWDTTITVSLSITMSRALAANEIKTFSLRNLANNNVLNGNVGTINSNTVAVTINAIADAGNYDIVLTDWCGNTIKDQVSVTLIVKPSITAVTPYCYPPNTSITTKVSFSSNLLTGQLISANSISVFLGSASFTLDSFFNSDQYIKNTSGLANGIYSLSFKDSSQQSISSSPINIFVTPGAYTSSITTVTPTIYDTTYTVTLSLQMNRVLNTNEISSFTLTNTSNKSVTTGTITSQTGGVVVVSTTAITTTGTYSITLTDFCKKTITTATNVTFIVQPTLLDYITPLCYLKNTAITSTVRFSANLLLTQLKSVSISPKAGGDLTNFSLGSFTNADQTITNPTGVNSGLYGINFTDSSNQVISSVRNLIVVETLVSSTITAVSPPVWDIGVNNINLALTMSRNLGPGEILTFKIRHPTSGVESIGTVSSQTGNTVNVSAPNAINTAGVYNIILTDYCGNTITGSNAITFVVIPSIVSSSPRCQLPSTKFSSKVTFSANLLTGQLKSASYINTDNNLLTGSISLGSFTGADQVLTTDNSGLAAATYRFAITDSANSLISASDTFLVTLAATPLYVTAISPTYFPKSTAMSFTITFNQNALLSTRITTLKLKAVTTGTLYTLTTISTSGYNVVVSLASGLPTYDDFEIVGTDICLNSIVSVIRISSLDKFGIKNYLPACSAINSAFNLSIDVDRSIKPGQVVSAALVDSSNANSSYSLILQQPATGLTLQAGNSGISKVGTYILKITDSANNAVTATTSFDIVNYVPQITNVSPNSFIRGSSTDFTFDIIFDQNVQNKYFTSIYLVDASGLLYSVQIKNIVNNKVTVTPLGLNVSSTKLTIKVNICNSLLSNASISITDPVSPINNNSNQNNSNSPTCQIGSSLDTTTNTCVDCKSLSQFYYNFQCVSSCPTGTFVNNDYICTQTCQVFDKFAFNNMCVSKCPDQYAAPFNGVCILCKTVGQFYLNGTCVTACPSTGYTINNDAYTCDPVSNQNNSVTPIIPITPSTSSVNCDVNTCNGGVCSVQLNQINCTCPTGKTGVYCDISSAIVNPSYMTSIVDQIVSSGSTTSSSQLAVVADNLLSNNANSVFTPDNSQKIYSFTTSQLENLKSTTAPADANSVLKLVNLAINFKSQELNSFAVKPASLRYLQETPGPAPLVNNSTTTTPNKPITTALDLSAAIKNYLTQKAKIKADVLNLVNLTNSYIDDYLKINIFNTSSNIMFGNTYVTVQIAFNSNSSLADLSDSSTVNSLPDINISDCLLLIASNNNLNWKNSLIVTKIIYSNLMNSLLDRSDLSQGLLYYQTRDISTKFKYDITSSCANVSIKYPISNTLKERTNFNLYQQYKMYGIDIYNKDDPYFTSRCKPTGDIFPYDTTLDYRRQSIFQNITMSCGSGCTYSGMDRNFFNYILCICSGSHLESFYTVDVSTFNYGPAPDVNLELFLCNKLGFSDQIHKNAGFWISLFAILFMLLFIGLHLCVFSGIVNGDNSRHNALEFDEIIINKYDEIVKTEKNKEDEIDRAAVDVDAKIKNVDPGDANIKNVNPDDIKLGMATNTKYINTEASRAVSAVEFNIYRNSSFCEIFGDLLVKNHPVLTLGHNSILCPFGLKLSLFVFKSFMYFSWNAFIFTDSLIARRINDNFRDNFAYPMAQEFGKIMASIVVTTILLEILRFITHQSDKNVILLRENSKKSDEKMKEACLKNYTSMFCRYATAIVIMLIFSVFFFYFNTVFCGVYPKASVGWFYSGVWSLIFVWFAFSPFFLFLLTMIEYCAKTSGCCLGLKSVFNVIIRYMF